MKCFGELQSPGPSLWLPLPELKGNKPSMLKITRAIWLVALRNFGVYGCSDERWISNHAVIHHPFMHKRGMLLRKMDSGSWAHIMLQMSLKISQVENFSKANDKGDHFNNHSLRWIKQGTKPQNNLWRSKQHVFIFSRCLLHTRSHIIRPLHQGLLLLLGHGNPS